MLFWAGWGMEDRLAGLWMWVSQRLQQVAVCMSYFSFNSSSTHCFEMFPRLPLAIVYRALLLRDSLFAALCRMPMSSRALTHAAVHNLGEPDRVVQAMHPRAGAL